MNKWIKLLLVILGFAVASIAIYFILKAFGITNINKLKEVILDSKQFGVIVYFLILVTLLTLLCFVPLLNTALVIMGIVIFGPLTTFIVCLLSNLCSGTILFFIGDKFGEKIATKFVTKEELEQAQDLIDTKSKILLPIFFILPGLPDEALCLVAGMTKMKYWYLITISLLYHALEIGLFCFFGSGLINWGSLSIIDWIVFINCLIIDLYFLFKLEKKIKK